MQTETKNLLKEILVRWNEKSQVVRDKLGLSPVKKSMIKMYLKAPYKIQYALAKFGLRLLAKKKTEQQEFIRH